jgi:hypothetical protein
VDANLNSMFLYLAAEDLPTYLIGNRDIGPSLMHRVIALQDCKERGPESEPNHHLKEIHGARDPHERRYAYLAQIIDLSRAFNAQDPKDRMFAPLSLVSRFVSRQWQAPQWIIPDYSQTASSVFTAVSTLLIKKLPIMSLLSMVEDRKEGRLLDLPSWVLDFSHPKLSISLAYASRYDIYKSLELF